MSTQIDETIVAAPSQSLAWPPPGLERLHGTAETLARIFTWAALWLALPLLIAVATRQEFNALGPFGRAWWFPLFTTTASIIVLTRASLRFALLLRDWQRARVLGYDFRTILHVTTDGTISRWLPLGQQIRAVCEYTGNAGRESETIEQLNLAALLDRTPQSFSGGELKRAALSLAYARNPTCLLADEPLYGIAPHDREIQLRAIRHLADNGCAVLVTGHEASDLLPAADRIAWLNAGSITILASAEAARAHHSFRVEYLG